MKDLQVRDRVHTVEGMGTVVEVSPSYGARVKFQDGHTEWFTFGYLTKLVS